MYSHVWQISISSILHFLLNSYMLQFSIQHGRNNLTNTIWYVYQHCHLGYHSQFIPEAEHWSSENIAKIIILFDKCVVSIYMLYWLSTGLSWNIILFFLYNCVFHKRWGQYFITILRCVKLFLWIWNNFVNAFSYVYQYPI